MNFLGISLFFLIIFSATNLAYPATQTLDIDLETIIFALKHGYTTDRVLKIMPALRKSSLLQKGLKKQPLENVILLRGLIKGQAILRYAALFGRLDIVKHFIEVEPASSESIDLHFRNDELVCNAILSAKTDLISYLIELGLDATLCRFIKQIFPSESKFYYYLTKELWIIPLHGLKEAVEHALLLGHKHVVFALLSKKRGWDTDRNSWALINAASQGHSEIVYHLIRKGASIDNYDNQALRSCALNGHLQALEILDDHGGNITDPNVMINAASAGHTEIVKYLIDRGIPVTQSLAPGYLDAFEKAAFNGHFDLVKYLVESRNANASDSRALNCALVEKHYGIARFLVENGASIDNLDLSRPLLHSVKKRDYDNFIFWLQRGAKVPVDSIHKAYFAVKIAVKSRDFPITKLLLENKIKPLLEPLTDAAHGDADFFKAVISVVEARFDDALKIALVNGFEVIAVHVMNHFDARLSLEMVNFAISRGFLVISDGKLVIKTTAA